MHFTYAFKRGQRLWPFLPYGNFLDNLIHFYRNFHRKLSQWVIILDLVQKRPWRCGQCTIHFKTQDKNNIYTGRLFKNLTGLKKNNQFVHAFSVESFITLSVHKLFLSLYPSQSLIHNSWLPYLWHHTSLLVIAHNTLLKTKCKIRNSEVKVREKVKVRKLWHS